jgi:NAD(P)-dependent dehydrogenase (short-subunit alcohol dehydrogenase family)
MNPFSLAGKVVWATGAWRGWVGRWRYRLRGRVRSWPRLPEQSVSLNGRLRKCALGAIDVYSASTDDTDAVEDVVTGIVAKHGRLDGLVNCAGISRSFVRAELLDDASWSQVLSVNLGGTFVCCRAAGRMMLRQASGSIVNMTSVHAAVGMARTAAYASSRGGIDELTKTLDVELADRGVCVNALVPGYFETGLSASFLQSRHGDRIRAAIPLGRIGQPGELGPSAVYLLSDASSCVTGSVLSVDGGWQAW